MSGNKIKIDVNASVTQRLSFQPLEEYDGLNLGYLIGVTFNESKSDNDAKWEFKGLEEVPRVTFEFMQHKDAFNTKDRFYVKSFLPHGVVDSKGAEREESAIVSDYMALWAGIKHIHDAFIGSPNYKPIDFPVEFDHEADLDTRVKEFKTFFQNVAKAFNEGKDGNPIYEPHGGKDNANLLVLKLIANNTGKYLEFPKYVGKGFIEKATIVNGRIDTGITFGVNERYTLGSANVTATQQANNPVSAEISDDIKNLLKNSGV